MIFLRFPKFLLERIFISILRKYFFFDEYENDYDYFFEKNDEYDYENVKKKVIN
jgi:hypothetical protein